jgi:hypothetical protein
MLVTGVRKGYLQGHCAWRPSRAGFVTLIAPNCAPHSAVAEWAGGPGCRMRPQPLLAETCQTVFS